MAHGTADQLGIVVMEKAYPSVVVEVENMLTDSKHSAEQWKAQSIFRVPQWIKDMKNSKAYHPQVVSLGPFHHDDPNLQPMEEHKSRALEHLVKRSRKPLQDFIAAVEEVAEQLEAAYGKDLDDKWRGENRHRFVEVMVTDGCFLLELILMGNDLLDYVSRDPVFSIHSRMYIWPVIRSDMLLMENQLPLLLLHSLLAVQLDIPRVAEMDKDINRAVLKFLDRSLPAGVIEDLALGLHPLDIYHESLVYEYGAHEKRNPLADKYEIMPSAVKIRAAGVQFRRSKTDRLPDIHFKQGVLRMPVVTVDDSTERLYLNLMAFERLFVGAGFVVTAYVTFMDNIIDSAEDVALLSSNGVLRNMLGSDKEAANLFNSTLSTVAMPCPSWALREVQRVVTAYYKKRRNKWGYHLRRTHFRNPWAIISLVAAVILLVATLMQTVYSALQFYLQL